MFEFEGLLVSIMSRTSQVVDVLISRALRIHRFLGWNPLDPNPSFMAKFYFTVACTYATSCFVQETIYLAQNVGTENAVLSLTNGLPCMGFAALAIVKISTIYGNREKLRRILAKLSNIKLEKFDRETISGFLDTSKKMTSILTVFYISLIWIFNLMPLFIITKNFFYDGSYQRHLPYLMWYPFDYLQPIVFEACYLVLMWGAFTCAIGILSADLMFCAITTLVCVQFDILKSKLRKIDDKKLPK